MCTIAQKLALKYEPVALIWSDQKPEGALQFEKGRWGCVMAAFAAAAEKGRTYAFDAETFGCPGGGVGLGFGNAYLQFMGGEEGFCGFLSSGNSDTPEGRALVEQAAKFMRGSMLEHFAHGEGYRKSPDAVRKFIKALPIMQVPTRYVIFKPLSQVRESDQVKSITFLANPDQISALTILANYDADDNERVIMPHAAGCQSIGIYGYRESAKSQRRAVVGLVDPSARKTIRRLGKDLLTFTVSPEMYAQMEQDLPGSFVERETWKSLGN